MKINILNMKCTLPFLVALSITPISQGFAHPGHADPVTISRATHSYMQKMVPHYLKLQAALSQGQFTDDAKAEAKGINHLVTAAKKKESDSSGKKMYKGIAKAAGFISTANDLGAVREEFSELNDIMMPFFNSWPNHLAEHDLVLYTCKETRQWWMQANGSKVADPYRGADAACSNLTEKME